MIIFQMAGVGCASSLGLKRGLLADSLTPPATTFRTNDYIHRLNRTLQAEVRTLSAYVSLSTQRPRELVLAQGTEVHHLASRELVRLIIAHRGVPEDRSTLSLGLTKRLVALFAHMPARLAERATTTTLRQLERQLVSNYQTLLLLAPMWDHECLRELLEQTQKQALNVGGLR